MQFIQWQSKYNKNKSLTTTKEKIQLTGCFVRMFLVCTFLVFILTVQFKLGWRWKKQQKIKTFLDIFSLYMLYLLLLVLYLVFWLCLKTLELCSLSHCSILKKWSISLWFSQWWQRRLSYLNGFYHFCSYWYYTCVIEITWQKKKRTENMLMLNQTEINIDWCTQLRAWFSLSVTTISDWAGILSRLVLRTAVYRRIS